MMTIIYMVQYKWWAACMGAFKLPFYIRELVLSQDVRDGLPNCTHKRPFRADGFQIYLPTVYEQYVEHIIFIYVHMY